MSNALSKHNTKTQDIMRTTIKKMKRHYEEKKQINSIKSPDTRIIKQ